MESYQENILLPREEFDARLIFVAEQVVNPNSEVDSSEENVPDIIVIHPYLLVPYVVERGFLIPVGYDENNIPNSFVRFENTAQMEEYIVFTVTILVWI